MLLKRIDKLETKLNRPAMQGKKTISSGYALGAVALLGLLGIDTNPELVINFVNETYTQLCLLISGLTGAIHYFKRISKNEND